MPKKRGSSSKKVPEKTYTFRLDSVADPNAPNGGGLTLNVEEISAQIWDYFESSKDHMGTIDLMIDMFGKLISLSECAKGVQRQDFAPIEDLLRGFSETIDMIEDADTWKRDTRSKIKTLLGILEGLEQSG